MGLTPATVTAPLDPPLDPPTVGSGRRRFSRSAALLDLVGLVALAWMLGLWRLGTFQEPATVATDASRLPSIPDFPGLADLTRRGQMGLALLVFAVLLAIVVLIRLGRPVGWVRPVVAAPLVLLLLGIGAWRVSVGWPPLLSTGLPYGTSTSAGLWDGSVVALGLAAAVLLAVRPERASRSRRLIVVVAVSASVTSSLVVATVTYLNLFGESEGLGQIGVALLLPPLILALIGMAMAPGWLQGMHRGHLGASAALLTWGLAIGGGVVIPQYLILVFAQGRGFVDMLGQFPPVAGLDWLEDVLVVAAAALIAPVAREFRAQDRAGRRQILRGPLAMLAILLFANLGTQLLQYYLISGPLAEQPEMGVQTESADQWIPWLSLAGAVLVLLVAIWPQRRSAPWTMTAGVLLITGPTAWYLAPLLKENWPIEPYDLGPGIPIPQLWDGLMIMLNFVLPLLLLVLLLIGGRAPVDPSPVGPSPVGPSPVDPGPVGPSSVGPGPDDSALADQPVPKPGQEPI